MISAVLQYSHYLQRSANALQHLFAIMARLYVGHVFFSAGLTKIKDWETTLFLFAEEYQVPLINYQLAAYLGTLGELLFPVLLVLGLFSRFAALGLFIVNIVAVISLAEISPAAYYLHVIWGILLAYIIAHGGAYLSLDTFLSLNTLKSKFQRQLPMPSKEAA